MGAMHRVRFGLLVAAVAVVGHDATYAFGHGLAEYPTALRELGHDGYWRPLGLGVLALLLAAAGLTAWRWQSVRRQLLALGWRSGRNRGSTVRWRSIVAQGGGLCLGALAVFLVQENLEHLAAQGGNPPGAGVLLGRGYLATLPTFAVVSILAAALRDLVAGRIHRLEIALARARRASLPRPPRQAAARSTRTFLASRPLSAQPDLGRAPPVANGVSP